MSFSITSRMFNLRCTRTQGAVHFLLSFTVWTINVSNKWTYPTTPRAFSCMVVWNTCIHTGMHCTCLDSMKLYRLNSYKGQSSTSQSRNVDSYLSRRTLGGIQLGRLQSTVSLPITCWTYTGSKYKLLLFHYILYN